MARHFHGFTLIELMVVMAIIAIASALIIPQIGSNETKRFQAQLQTLTAAINYNRRSAIIMNHPFTMTLSPFVDQEINQINSHQRSKGNWISQGAEIHWQSGAKKIHNKPFTVTFFPQGGATGGQIILQQNSKIARLNIDGITGKVTIKEDNYVP